jgi:hypothetical protein
MNQPKQTAAELLQRPVMTVTEVAEYLRLEYSRGAKKGKPKRTLVIALVDKGVIRPIDPTEPTHRWRFSRAAIDRYIGEVAA